MLPSITGISPGDLDPEHEQERNEASRNLLEYLLDIGCDPNFVLRRKAIDALVFQGILTQFLRCLFDLTLTAPALVVRNSSAIEAAVMYGAWTAMVPLLAHQADIDVINDRPGQSALAYGYNANNYGGLTKDSRQRIDFLRDHGFQKWQPKLPGDHLLFAACEGGDIKLMMFCLETAGIDPDMPGRGNRSCLGALAETDRDFLGGIALLLEYHADVQGRRPRQIWLQTTGISGPCGASCNPLMASFSGRRSGEGGETVAPHHLLFRGADPRIVLGDSIGPQTAWCRFWSVVYPPSDRTCNDDWSYPYFEGTLTHLLLHGADPFETLTCEPCRLGGFQGIPRWWDNQIGEVDSAAYAKLWSYFQDEWLTLPGNYQTWDPSELPNFGRLHEAERSWIPRDVATWSEQGRIIMVGAPRVDVRRLNEFFQDASTFHYHVSNEEGRQQLARLPLVRALCDALQNAGYRAEMDDSGDIWYESDDGDRYFDARAVQPPRGGDDDDDEGDEDEDDECSAKYCKICQNLDFYGLGIIREKEAVAKRAIREYQEERIPYNCEL